MNALRTIGILAPSAPFVGSERIFFSQTLQRLRDLGYRLCLGTTLRVRTGTTAGSIRSRVSDIHSMFENPSIDAILTTTGGFNANELLEFLDFERIAATPKPFVGYSDVDALSLALAAKSSIPTVCGPMLVDDPHDATALHRLLQFLKDGVLDFSLPTELWEGRGEPRRNTSVIHTLPDRHVTAQGKIVAANLSTFALLLGTPFLPSLGGCILFLEYDLEERHALPSLRRFLWQLRHAGVFKIIRGLVFGTLPAAVAVEEHNHCNLRTILRDLTEGTDFPVLWDAPFGHVYPSWILPYGCLVSIDRTAIHAV